MIATILLATATGKILLRRDYKNSTQPAATSTAENSRPIHPKARGLHAVTLSASKREQSEQQNAALLLTALTTQNSNTLLVLEFLAHLRHLFNQFIGELTQASVQSNCTTIHSILEEAIDFGIPQLTDAEALRPLLLMDEPSKSLPMTPSDLRKVTDQWTEARSWRREDIKHKKNEVYIDVVEDVNASISHTGEVLLLEVVGHVAVRTMLSGMPECRLGLNDRATPNKCAAVVMENLRFHNCLCRSEQNERGYSFIPPDGSFQLMSYRVTKGITLPFLFTPQIKQSGNRIEVVIRVKAQLPKTTTALLVKAKIPLPDLTARVTVKSCTSGKATFIPGERCVEWSWKRLSGESEGSLSFDVDLAASGRPLEGAGDEWVGRGKAPIIVSFDLPTVAASGLKVRFLKVQESSGYKTVKWIRYLTRSGNYSQRI